MMLELRGVTYRYPSEDFDTLQNLSFSVEEGEFVSIIGVSGCGKSTIVSLLMRLYDADAGEIRIGGQRVEAIPPEVLHTKFGVVFQNDILFADTIAENIDFGRGLSREQI